MPACIVQQDNALDLSGDVMLYRDDGTTLYTESAAIDLKQGAAAGSEPVHAEGPFGRLDAKGFALTDKGEEIQFAGPAQLLLNGSQTMRPPPGCRCCAARLCWLPGARRRGGARHRPVAWRPGRHHRAVRHRVAAERARGDRQRRRQGGARERHRQCRPADRLLPQEGRPRRRRAPARRPLPADRAGDPGGRAGAGIPRRGRHRRAPRSTASQRKAMCVSSPRPTARRATGRSTTSTGGDGDDRSRPEADHAERGADRARRAWNTGRRSTWRWPAAMRCSSPRTRAGSPPTCWSPTPPEPAPAEQRRRRGRRQTPPPPTQAAAAGDDALAASGKLEKVEAFGHVSVRTPTDIGHRRSRRLRAGDRHRAAGRRRADHPRREPAQRAKAEVNQKTGISRLLSGMRRVERTGRAERHHRQAGANSTPSRRAAEPGKKLNALNDTASWSPWPDCAWSPAAPAWSRGVGKTYKKRPVVRNVSIIAAARRGGRAARPQRRRQDHDLLHDRRADPARYRRDQPGRRRITGCRCIAAPGWASAICRRKPACSAA